MATSTAPNNYDGGAGEDVGAYAGMIATMMAFPMVMMAAIELGVLEIIAGADRSGRRISAAEIADRLSASDKKLAADMLERMLRPLAAFAVVTCSVDGSGRRVYGMAPVTSYFVRDEENASFGPYMSLIHDEVSFFTWRKLKDAILDGRTPFNKAYGMDFFDYNQLHPKYNNTFHKGMQSHTSVVMREILQNYKGFESLKQLVDVGGGTSHTLEIIVSKYPMLKAINFDLPYVIDKALKTPGIEYVGGDMFVSIPSPAEAILMKLILHDWSDEQCVKVLTNCCKALSNNGKVIVIEHVIADHEVIETTPSTKAIFLMDVAMMAFFPQGKERTMKEFTTLAMTAGFTTINFACYACNLCVMEFCK